MFDSYLPTIVTTIAALVVWSATNYLVFDRPKAERTVAALKRRLSERLEQALDDVRRYESKAAQGVAGYTPGGNVAIVKIEFHDWFEGFTTGLHDSVPYAIREKLNLHTYDDMLRKIDPNHNQALWAQDLKVRANRW
ncbi:TPA: hypothetical protein ACOEBF_001317 [Stenotrophomonas maltophilia]|uniref:hypothetical protein n=1 Tax=Stenotrophomonas maltophilia TaxID=40324 RepID=UPI0021CA3840|nr:hypothetical protein [Stenotrophomonas maltophilia]MCU1124937.1 hypothetical protein [Stenotrophomonas maltophilia]MCU1142274.1 hypothetical protein [Stenotrophomonas maltophilia]